MVTGVICSCGHDKEDHGPHGCCATVPNGYNRDFCRCSQFLLDPLKEWARVMAEKFKNSKPGCAALALATWMPDSGFPFPKINMLTVGEKDSCQCEHCLLIRNKIDEILIRAFHDDAKN